MSPTAPPLTLRTLTAADVADVARMHAAQTGGCPHFARLVFGAMAESPLAVVEVAVDGDRPVGYAVATTDAQRLLSDVMSRHPGPTFRKALRHPLRFLAMLRSPKPAQVLFLYLEPEYRGRHVGLRLLTDALDALRRRGIDEVWFHAVAEEAGLLGALAGNGFVPDADGWHVRRALGADPSYRPGPFTASDRLRCLLRLELLVLAPIYGLALIPFASLLAWLGTGLDRRAGLPPMLPEPWNFLAAAAFLAVGGALLVWSYTFLILEGEGGPVPPFSAKTRRLVTTGPYAVVRHPSILAKLLGVMGLGLAFNSWSFTCGIIPMLLCWSVLWNQERQDKDLVRVFGEEYLEYRRRTPMLFPRLFGRRR